MGTEITVLSSGSAQAGLDLIAAAFKKATGHTASITYNLDEKGSQRLDEGGIVDVIVGSSESLNRNFRSSGLVEQGGAVLGRMGIGLFTRAGAPMPDVSSVEALTRATLDADTIILSNHSSGYYIDTILEKMGITEQVKAKIVRYPNGPEMLNHAVNGKGKELGYLTLNQIRGHKGVVLLGPLPEEVQLFRDFIAVPTTRSPNKQIAWDFVNFCGGPGKATMLENGFL